MSRLFLDKGFSLCCSKTTSLICSLLIVDPAGVYIIHTSHEYFSHDASHLGSFLVSWLIPSLKQFKHIWLNNAQKRYSEQQLGIIVCVSTQKELVGTPGQRQHRRRNVYLKA